jgi:uncharacterized membrane protein YgcG
MRVARCVIVAALISLPLLAATPAWAAEQIRSYDVAIAIEPDGDLLVTEIIDYDFGTRFQHGIFRNIPVRYAWDQDPALERVYRIEDISVSSDTAPDDLDVSESGVDVVLRIGDPDEEITGEHVYTIRYRVVGALNGFEAHDELYWNAIGDEWSVGIGRASVRVETPGTITEVACFAGPSRSVLECDRARSEGSVATFVQKGLPQFQAFTVVVALPKGAVSPPPAPILEKRLTLATAFEPTPGSVGGAIAAAVVALGGVAMLLRGGRDRRYRGSPVDQTMGGVAGDEAVPFGDADAGAPVEFAPPDGFRPGELGTLMDERANTLDVTATIIDLAVRGYLTIEEIPKKGLFGKDDWQLSETDGDVEALKKYEQTLVHALFRNRTTVLLSELRKRFAADLVNVQDALYEDAVTEGWFTGRPDRVRTRWTRFGVVALVASGWLTYQLATEWRLGLIGAPLVIASLMLVVGARRMPARTAKGTAALRRARGFRTVIEKAETHMSRWAEEEGVFTRYLPYAIVFGCTDKWARAFDSLGEDAPAVAAPDWYVSSRPFVYSNFADSIDSFTVSTSGTIASTPGSSGLSGFSSGGGSSGGGGGGGGGGSW